MRTRWAAAASAVIIGINICNRLLKYFFKEFNIFTDNLTGSHCILALWYVTGMKHRTSRTHIAFLRESRIACISHELYNIFARPATRLPRPVINIENSFTTTRYRQICANCNLYSSMKTKQKQPSCRLTRKEPSTQRHKTTPEINNKNSGQPPCRLLWRVWMALPPSPPAPRSLQRSCLELILSLFIALSLSFFSDSPSKILPKDLSNSQSSVALERVVLMVLYRHNQYLNISLPISNITQKTFRIRVSLRKHELQCITAIINSWIRRSKSFLTNRRGGWPCWEEGGREEGRKRRAEADGPMWRREERERAIR